MKRYFFASYTTLKNNQISGVGNCSQQTDGVYFNMKSCMDSVKKEIKCDKVIINNIIELSATDFNDLYQNADK